MLQALTLAMKIRLISLEHFIIVGLMNMMLCESVCMVFVFKANNKAAGISLAVGMDWVNQIKN